MIDSTPSAAAAAIAASPTAPTPYTTRLSSFAGLITLSTVPAPVWKPQPYGASRVRSSSGSTLTQLSAYASACAARLDWPKKLPNTGLPSRWSEVLPSIRMPM